MIFVDDLHRPEGPALLPMAFGLDRRLYVTEQSIGRIEVLEVETDGWPLYRSCH